MPAFFRVSVLSFLILSGIGVSLARAGSPEAPYIPPPLFSSSPAPVAVPAPPPISPPDIVVVPTLPPDDTGSEVPPVDPTPPDLNPEDLLAHPADRVAPKVQGAVSPDVLPMEPGTDLPAGGPVSARMTETLTEVAPEPVASEALASPPVPAAESLLGAGDNSDSPPPGDPAAAAPLPDRHIQGDPHVLLLYSGALTELTTDLQQSVEENVLPRLLKNPDWRLEIRAYASPSEDAQSGDRRIALARALAVRAFLREKGIAAARMDVRALGRNTDRKPYDRVDLVFLSDGAPVRD